MEESGAEVAFESLELGHEGAALGPEVARRRFQGREGHGDVEAVQPVPAVQCAFDRPANVAGQGGVEWGQHHGAAANTLRTQGDVELSEPAANRLVLDADFPGDVVGGAFADEVLLAEPVLVDGPGPPGVADRQPDRAGLFDDEERTN
ncbi:hypothetical protein ACIBCM_26960 [Streptomyces sp. NPDC051018]|uniref:hypothetical protein n=1 Tax=Streptomyces sp. NPDC051018 TaxID=3365639 RepID=UPI00379E715D